MRHLYFWSATKELGNIEGSESDKIYPVEAAGGPKAYWDCELDRCL